MKIKKVFIALCASALFFNFSYADNLDTEKKYLFNINGFPFINVGSVCIDNQNIIDSLKQYTDTSINIMCLSYGNDSDQFVITFPLQISKKYVVFMFKVYQNNCLEFISQTFVRKDDIPFICCEDGIYKIITCCE